MGGVVGHRSVSAISKRPEEKPSPLYQAGSGTKTHPAATRPGEAEASSSLNRPVVGGSRPAPGSAIVSTNRTFSGRCIRNSRTALTDHYISEPRLAAIRHAVPHDRIHLWLSSGLPGGFLPRRPLGGGTWALRWLVAASLFFYAWWSPAYLPLLVGSVLANHAIARRLRCTPITAHWLAAGIALNLALLGWFKYADFLLHIVAPDAPELHITLPLAISFFTFQQIMFLVDAARAGTRQELPRLLPYAVFVTFFPHLIAGPIVRPAEIIPQLMRPRLAAPRSRQHGRRAADVSARSGQEARPGGPVRRLRRHRLQCRRHAAPRSASSRPGTPPCAYALQIYFDFSGYSDMAIGLARMLNVRFPLNFDSPYQAADIAAFWRRWHMTLSGFLRDYLYIPLGGNRVGEVRGMVNLMVTMLLAGLWHGAAWNFVCWGGLHGLFLMIHAQYRRWFPPMPAPIGRALTCLPWSWPGCRSAPRRCPPRWRC